MSEHVFKPGDTAVITSNDARGSCDPEGFRIDLAEGDRVEVARELDGDGDYLVAAGNGDDWFVAARFLAPADEPAPWAEGDEAIVTAPDHPWEPADRIKALAERVGALERRLQGIIETHRLRDGS
jgi:hypothetical protein